MAQHVERPTLDLGSGRDLVVVGLSPMSGSALGVDPAWDSLSPSPAAPTQQALSQKTTKTKTKKHLKHRKQNSDCQRRDGGARGERDAEDQEHTYHDEH